MKTEKSHTVGTLQNPIEKS